MSAGGVEQTVSMANQRGLHARASAKFVQLAESFSARISVSKDGETVNATSIMGLMMLAASFGTMITIRAEGRDAEAALAALVALVEAKFGEE